ncbi:unnamed protein product [Lampetra planeri]
MRASQNVNKLQSQRRILAFAIVAWQGTTRGPGSSIPPCDSPQRCSDTVRRDPRRCFVKIVCHGDERF